MKFIKWLLLDVIVFFCTFWYRLLWKDNKW